MPRKQIARELRRLREEGRLALQEVARGSEVSTSTLSRLENGQAAANAPTIKAIVEFYEIADTERGQNLINWARDGRKPGWWVGHPGAEQEPDPSYVAYEAQAVTARVFMNQFFSTQLQAPGYARELARRMNPGMREEESRQVAAFRAERQEQMRRRDGMAPLELHAIVHETCLTQPVGTAGVMRDQLTFVLDVIKELPATVTVQVLERTAPPHRAMLCPWVQFSYPADIGSASFVDTHLGLRLFEDAVEMDRITDDFAELSEMSLSPAESAGRIEAVRDALYPAVG